MCSLINASVVRSVHQASFSSISVDLKAPRELVIVFLVLT